MNNKEYLTIFEDKETKTHSAKRNTLLAVNIVQTISAQLSWDGLIP
jgi:hypothetical protein